jgi:hypothetical protein
MADVIFLVVTVAFFALCGLYVRGCDRIVQSTEDLDGPTEVR